jgi:hypothetical protein
LIIRKRKGGVEGLQLSSEPHSKEEQATKAREETKKK